MITALGGGLFEVVYGSGDLFLFVGAVGFVPAHGTKQGQSDGTGCGVRVVFAEVWCQSSLGLEAGAVCEVGVFKVVKRPGLRGGTEAGPKEEESQACMEPDFMCHRYHGDTVCHKVAALSNASQSLKL